MQHLWRSLLFFLTLTTPLCSELFTVRGNAYHLPQASEVFLKIAHTPDTQRWGLMGTNKLASNQGMLFIYPNKERRTVWMFNCNQDLDLAFLDHDFVIQEIYSLKAYPERMDPERPIQHLDDIEKLYPHGDPIREFFQSEAISSKGSYPYFMELPQGFLEKHKLYVGTQLNVEKDQHSQMLGPFDLVALPKDIPSWVTAQKRFLFCNTGKKHSFMVIELNKHNAILDTYLLPKESKALHAKRHFQCETLLFVPAIHPLHSQLKAGMLLKLEALFP